MTARRNGWHRVAARQAAWVVAVALGGVLALAAGRRAAGAAPPPAVPAVAPGVARVVQSPGARRLEVSLPGHVVAAALPRVAGGRRLIALLLAPESDRSGSRSLAVVDPAGGGSLAQPLSGLHGAADSLAALDLDADGTDELLLGEPGALSSLGPPPFATPRALVEGPLVGLASVRGGLPGAGRGGDRLDLAEAGLLRRFHPDGRGGLAAEGSWELPLRAAREPSGLALATPPVTAVALPGRGPLYAVGPEAVGSRRLRTLLIDPEAEGDARRVEAWSLLPAPERVLASWVLALDGRPALVVATADAHKLGVFDKQRLRLFTLGADRTRTGRPPAVAFETESPRWRPVLPDVADLDRDGHDDLLVVGAAGVRGKSLLARVFLGRGDGRWEDAGRSSRLDLEAYAWGWGADLTGDGLADLVAVSADHLDLYAGAADPRRGPFEARPRRSVEMATEPAELRVDIDVGERTFEASPPPSPFAVGRPWLVDLDGDGRAEVVLISPGDKHPGTVTVVWFQ